MNGDLDPQLKALVRLAHQNQHGGLGSPESLANLVRAQMLASIETCDDCDMQTNIIPAARQRWVVEHRHLPHCPLYDGEGSDNAMT